MLLLWINSTLLYESWLGHSITLLLFLREENCRCWSQTCWGDHSDFQGSAAEDPSLEGENHRIPPQGRWAQKAQSWNLSRRTSRRPWWGQRCSYLWHCAICGGGRCGIYDSGKFPTVPTAVKTSIVERSTEKSQSFSERDKTKKDELWATRKNQLVELCRGS